MAAGPKSAPAPGHLARRLIAAGLLALTGGCGRPDVRPAEVPELHQARIALGASFIGGRASGLRKLLHSDLIVQPPAPDSASRGLAAADYLAGLAQESQVTRSQLLPLSVGREGSFLLERGVWHLSSGDRTFTSRYTIRWSASPAGWKVVLWRWTLFR